MTHTGDVAAGVGTVALNVITWGGFLDAMNGAQVVLTVMISVATLIYIGYGIVSRARKLDDSK